jgi:hypothetical protein
MFPALARLGAALGKPAARSALGFITDLPLGGELGEIRRDVRAIRARLGALSWLAAAGVALLAIIAAGVWRHL